MADKATYGPKANHVWQVDAELGFRPSVDGAGTVAAPLLAGFSFTLLVLLLPTLEDTSMKVKIGSSEGVIRESKAFSGAPELAAIFLLVAGLLLVACVQAVLTMRYHDVRPSTLQEWFPHLLPVSSEVGKEPDRARSIRGWEWKDATPIAVGTSWYAGYARWRLWSGITSANRWARAARHLYHGGIMSLLLGLLFLVVPTGDPTPARWVLLGLATLGVAAELGWIGWNAFKEWRATHPRG